MGSFLFVTIPLLLLIFVSSLLAWVFSPPFGHGESSARVLVVGLDEPDRRNPDGPRRADTILLCAARLNGSGATLLSVPRDALIDLRGLGGPWKINAAYAFGKENLLKQVLADSSILAADLPYHIVIDSNTVRAVVDALGGISVDVPYDMRYNDDWGGLHIDLKAGRQILNGEQTVGYLRWRKDNYGRVGSDFLRSERQREVLIAIAQQAKTVSGALRLPAAYRAFQQHAIACNLSFFQLLSFGWACRKIESTSVPATPAMVGGISYVYCDWDSGRELWSTVIK